MYVRTYVYGAFNGTRVHRDTKLCWHNMSAILSKTVLIIDADSSLL